MTEEDRSFSTPLLEAIKKQLDEKLRKYHVGADAPHIDFDQLDEKVRQYREGLAEAGAPRLDLDKWDQRYLDLARHVAQWSKDPSTKVGAVAVGADRRKIALGYNGFPPGVTDTLPRLRDRETKYSLIQHAERNVLDNADFPLTGGTLAVTMFPCHECAKSIVSKGIRRVISPPIPDREPWRSSAQWTLQMFDEVGIELVIVCPPRSTELD